MSDKKKIKLGGATINLIAFAGSFSAEFSGEGAGRFFFSLNFF
jgi:hypothetical protein